MVRIGHTTIDSVTRAMQSLCNNNVLGIVVNGARRGELYSKYTYYHSYYTPKEEPVPHDGEAESEGRLPKRKWPSTTQQLKLVHHAAQTRENASWASASESSPAAAMFPASIPSSRKWFTAAAENRCEVIGIRRGWEGLTHVNLDDPASSERYILPLDRDNTRTIDRYGGTMLHSSRTNPSKMKKLPRFPVAREAFPRRTATTWDMSSAGAEEPGEAEARLPDRHRRRRYAELRGALWTSSA